MKHAQFQKSLEKELPVWEEKGWVTKQNSESILEHVGSSESRFNLLAFGIAVLGVLLLGSGIITYFAANWAEMAKITKLILLFSAMYVSFACAGYFLKTDKSPMLGQALLVLGVIIFGANIMLIAQIYHIDEHYPNGVLFWALGGLVTAYLMKSHAVLVLTIALSVLWTSLETFGFNHIHFWYLAIWVTFLPLIYFRRWNFALHLALIALIIWSIYSFFGIDYRDQQITQIYLVQLYFVLYLTLFLIGMLCATTNQLNYFAKPLQNYGAFAALLSFYMLTFPEIQRGFRYFDDHLRTQASTVWLALTFSALVLLVILAIWHRSRVTTKEKPKYLIYGQFLIAAVVLLIIFNLFLAGNYGGWMAIALNLLFFAGMIWLLFAGTHTNNRTLINLAFLFFALALITRYFDTFWSLLNRSFFFMAGGIILIIGGYFLEKQRRKLTATIASSSKQVI
ncbi:MAG: DUF2157 domain-containing protein [Gammaproteobacteria bacterium]|nr:MAG: DUF2157 domain-containing protein [Gammaproteobacteria bacterium]